MIYKVCLLIAEYLISVRRDKEFVPGVIQDSNRDKYVEIINKRIELSEIDSLEKTSHKVLKYSSKELVSATAGFISGQQQLC